jgi:hypothetical protein
MVSEDNDKLKNPLCNKTQRAKTKLINEKIIFYLHLISYHCI